MTTDLKNSELDFGEICVLRDFWEKEMKDPNSFYSNEVSEKKFQYYNDWVDRLIAIAEDTPF